MYSKENHSGELIIVFLKNQLPGKVKTRLAVSIGDKRALQVYRQLVRHTIEVTAPLQVDKQLWYSHFIPDYDPWDLPNAISKVQDGEDLGERMSQAFGSGFDAEYKKIVLIGTDCPHIQQQHLESAFTALNGSDVVLGPSLDGGYYLIGMKQRLPILFRDMPWSTDQLLEKTLSILDQQILNVQMLETLNDIDTIEDLKASGLSLS